VHSQVLVIKPVDVELEDVMYPYQEIDKDNNGKIKDDRCQFFLTLKNEDVPLVLKNIETYLIKNVSECLEMIQYRAEHSLKEFEEKYGNGSYPKDCYNNYKYWCDKLNEFYGIKDLHVYHPKQITFIKEYAGWATDKWVDIYIKDIGYGTFHNPYELWDYYGVVNEHRFPDDANFLVRLDGEKYNQLKLIDLDVDKTVDNINEWTMVWENIIFCKDDPANSELYTINDIRFSKKCNEHCLVDNLKDKLIEISEKYSSGDYTVTALDFHW